MRNLGIIASRPRVPVGSFIASFLLAFSPFTALAQTPAGSNAWIPLGTLPVVTTAKAEIAIALGPDATVYLAYSDASEANSPVNVRYYNRTSGIWQSIGSSFSKEPYDGLAIIATSTAIYVANTEYLGGGPGHGKLAIYSYNLPVSKTGQWTLMNMSGIAASVQCNSTPCLAMDANNQLYVAGTTQNGSIGLAAESNRPYIYSLANGAPQWTALATAGLPAAGPVDSFCLRIGPSPSLTPYLAYRSKDLYVQVESYASDKWTPLTRSTNLGYLSLTADIGLIDVDAKGNIYAVTNHPGPVISQYAGSGQQWNAVGGSFASTTEVAGVSVAGNGALYAFYRTSSAQSQPRVKVYSSGTWSDVGTIAQAPNPVNSMHLAVQTAVLPIFAYTTFDPSTMHHRVFVIQGPTPSQ